jgi:tetratricopeptide (TPR) repeat protein
MTEKRADDSWEDNMEWKDIIFMTVAGAALIVSVINLIWNFRWRAFEHQGNTRKALTDVVDELTKVSIAYNRLELDYPKSTDVTVVNLRRNYNNRRRYLASHGEFLHGQIPELTSDIDCIELAYAFASGGDDIKAQKFYELAVKKSPNDVLRMWNLRGFARFWFAQGNAQLGREAYEKSLKQQVPDKDSYRQMIADTYLMWSRLENEHGYGDEAKRVCALGQQEARRIVNSRMRERMLKQLSGVLTEAGNKSDGQSASN